MIEAITEHNVDAACALLHEGFPERPRGTWERGIERMRDMASRTSAEPHFGALMLDAGEPVGVALLPTSLRRQPDGSERRQVNLSSWYLRPEQRWRAAVMLRWMMRDRTAVYVDLTATADVQKMLALTGFQRVDSGAVHEALPVSLLDRASRRFGIQPWRDGDSAPVHGPCNRLVEHHRALGWQAMWLVHDEGRDLFVYRPRRLRRLPAVQAMYVQSHRRLEDAMPVLARHLLAKGHLFLTRDARSWHQRSRGRFVRHGHPWFACGQSFDDSTDFLGSEFGILDLY